MRFFNFIQQDYAFRLDPDFFYQLSAIVMANISCRFETEAKLWSSTVIADPGSTRSGK
jgi:hypothetical protein